MSSFSTQCLVDLALDEGIGPSRMFWEWDEFSDWSFQSLVALGLKPTDSLLDVGCGPLRLGVQAIPYLETGRYYGVDAFEPYLNLGRRLLRTLEIDRSPNLLHSPDFPFARFGEQFDVAFAQSVFTHLSQADVDRCTAALAQVMKPGGWLLFTHTTKTRIRGDLYDQRLPMIHSGQPVAFLEDLARRHNLGLELTPLRHPTQKVAVLRFQ